MKILVCRKGCHMTDRNDSRCRRCGGEMIAVDAGQIKSLQNNINEKMRSDARDEASGRYVNKNRSII